MCYPGLGCSVFVFYYPSFCLKLLTTGSQTVDTLISANDRHEGLITMKATNKQRITLRKFESFLMEKHDGQLEKRKHVEVDHENYSTTTVWLYYRTDVDPLVSHCASWSSGRGWEFTSEMKD
mgnify:FL=1